MIMIRSVNDDGDGDGDDNTKTRFVQYLPNDVLVNILSRLDLVTLYRCASVSTQLSLLLPEIRNLATTLPPASVTPYDEPSSLYELMTRYSDKLIMQPMIMLVNFLPPAIFLSSIERVWIPEFSKPVHDFLLRLTGLESLEIQFNTPDSIYPPNSYFRWISEYDVESKGQFFLFLDATIVPQKQDTLEPLSWPTVLPRLEDILRRTVFYGYASYPLSFIEKDWPDKLQTVVMKDGRKNGRQIISSKPDFVPNDEKFIRQFCCYLPILTLNNESLYIKDVIIYCVYIGNDIGKDIPRTEFVTTLLKNTRDCKQDRELARTLQNILQHDELVVVTDEIDEL